MDELISVIIPVYNTAEYLPRCLNSVVNNTYKKLEIILVDDGSTDGSSKICDEFEKMDSRFIVMHQENKGQASARNKALDIAKGDYIVFIDSDDFIHNRYFEIMLETLKKTDSDIVMCELTRDMDYDDFFSQSSFSIAEEDKHSLILSTYTGEWERNIAPWNKIYKKVIFDNLRFPVGKKYEDAMVTYKALMKAAKISCVDIIMYYWYRNNNSTTSQRSNAITLLDRELALREQMNYYPQNYDDVNKAARRFYLNQMLLMLWKLDNDFVKNDTTKKVRIEICKKLKKYYKMYKGLCSKEEQIKIFEYLYPTLSGVYYKVKHTFGRST